MQNYVLYYVLYVGSAREQIAKIDLACDPRIRTGLIQ